GLHSGKALVGNIGTAQLMNFTAIGDCVNVAQRLQAMSHGGQVLLSADSYRHVFSAVEVRSLGETRVRGRSEPITVYEFLGFKGEK
ncbi:MAG: adenylate/guanylate cyclase domain-containing protein, partial [Anaerolineae bacterium]